MVHDAWVEVDLGALRHNLKQVRSVVAEQVKLMAVVKGNGFGHGYVEPARAFLQAGADALGVTRIDEALALRAVGIDAPVLLFAPVQGENVEAAVAADLDMTVTAPALVQVISAAAQRVGKTARVHVKVDTGMGRLGVPPDAAPGLIATAAELPAIEVAGIYTHFASATKASTATAERQLSVFRKLLGEIETANQPHGLAHAANSAAILRLSGAHLDMVRPGTLLYGQYPSPHVPRILDLKPTWQLKARVCDIRTLKAGTPVGYGAEHVTRRETRVAIVPIGFADGFTLVPEGPVYRMGPIKFVARKARRSPAMEIRGHRAPVLGRVAMQLTVLDITGISGVQVGDEVTVPAMRIPTSALIPRVYTDSSS